MNIVLIGFMATGKSQVGQILAKRLGWAFYDTDAMIEQDTGFRVRQIFANKGEEAFRELEARTVSLVALLDKAVIATGGGVPLREDNMQELERNGVVVWLKASPETVLKRLGEHLDSRPLLKGPNPRQIAEDILNQRQKAYQRSRHQVDTDGLTPDQVAEKILELIHESKK